MHAVVATIIRDQDNPARHPFVTGCSATVANFKDSACFTPPTPAGQEVVIETVTFSGSGDRSNVVLAPQLVILSAASAAQIFLNPMFDNGFGQPSFSNFSGVQSLRLYADPGVGIACEGVTAALNPGGLSVSCTISGYFVTLP